MQCEHKVVVESIIIRNKHALLTRRSPQAKTAPGVWNVPAGKVKEGESPADAVVREVFEETGYRIREPGFVGVRSFSVQERDFRRERTVHTFQVLLDTGSPEPLLNFEHSEYAWVDECTLPNPLFDSLMPELRTMLGDSLRNIAGDLGEKT